MSAVDMTISDVFRLLDLAYEAACDAADRDLIDYSLIGAPLAEAIALLRAES